MTEDPTRDREDARSVHLPDRVLARVDARLQRTRFDSRAAYVTYVLEEVLARVEDGDDGGREVDEREVQQRLESLGYLE